MWNQDFNRDIFENDPFDRFGSAGGVTTGKGDWAWLQHTLACLNERGRAAVVLDTGAVTRGSGARHEDRERNIRRWFVERDLIDGVILLPDNLFYNTNAAGIILVLSKRKPEARKGKIVLVNASQRVGKGRPKNFIPQEDIQPVAAMFLKGEPVDGEVAVITQEQAAEADYNLSPSRWVGQTEAVDHRPISEIIADMQRLDEEARELDAVIGENAGASAMNEVWTWRPLGEVTIPGSTWNPRTDPRPLIRYVDVSAVSREELRIVSDVEHSSDNAPSRARKIMKTGDTIFATVRPALRRIAQIPPSLDGEIMSTAFCVLRPNPSVIHPDFLYFATQLDSVTDGIASKETGASYPAVRDSDVLSQAIPVPPLSDQSAIATALNLVRSTLLNHRRCEDAAMNLKRAAMQTLFTCGLRGEPQKDSEVGPLPESWEHTTLGDLCKGPEGAIQTGPFGSQLHRDDYEETGVPVVNPTHLIAGRISHENVPRVSNENANRLKRHKLCVGDIVFARRGQIGRMARVTETEEGWLCGTGSFLVRARQPSVDNCFLHFQLSTEPVKAWLTAHAAGAIMPNLNNLVLRQVPVFLPSTDEQGEIVAILDAIDRKIGLHQRKRAVLEELFKTLLHKLMTGMISVEDLDLSEIEVN